MKPYIKPSIEVIELRAEEGIAAALSNPAGGPSIFGILNGQGVGVGAQNQGQGNGPKQK